MFYFLTKKTEALIMAIDVEKRLIKIHFEKCEEKRVPKLDSWKTKYLFNNITIIVIGTLEIIVVGDIIYWLVNNHSGAT